MKNHLSTLPSIGAGGRFSPGGILERALWSTKSGELELVTLALSNFSVNPIIGTSQIYLQADVSFRGSTGDESLPGVSAFADDLLGIPMQ